MRILKSIPWIVLVLSITNAAHAASWGRNSLWNDGRAEVAFYDAERVVYGKTRKFQEQLVIVKEDLRQDTLVKADNPKSHKTHRVFKLNQIQKFDTENYPYSYMTSVFVDDEQVKKVLKMTVGSQEWCGNTFKIYRDGELNWYSYFDGEADQKLKLDLGENDYFEDQLPLSLRALPFKKGYEEKIRAFNFLTTNRGIEPVLQEITLAVVDEEIVRCRAGSLPSWKVVLKYPDGTDTYWFEKAAPNILTKMETRDGRKRLLYGRARWSYWDRRLPKPNVLK